MSTEEEQKANIPQENTNTNTNNKSNNIQNNSNNLSKEELLKQPFIKDLLIKIDVLKNGIIKEKKLNQELTAKLKKFEVELTSKIIKSEEELVSKTSQIKTLIQEKIDLEKALKQAQSQKKGSKFFPVFNKNQNNGDNNNDNLDPNSLDAVSSMANTEIRKLHETISQLKFENETYMQKMNSTLEQAENTKLEFKNEIKTYTDKIKSLEEEIKMLQEEKEELQDRIKLTSSISSQTLKETEHFKTLLHDYKKGKDDAVSQLNTWVEKCNKLTSENDSYKKKIENLEENSLKMAQKLSELKSLNIKANLRNQVYHVKRVGIIKSPEIDIIFGKGEEGNYVMRLDCKEGMEVINIQDVESVNRVKNSKNKVEIKYMNKGKKKTMNVLVNEVVVEQFVEAYKVFYFESMKSENQV